MSNLDQTRVVCIRVEPGYVPPVPSYKDACPECDTELWRALNSPHPQAKAICLDCLFKKVGLEDVIVQPPTPEQVEEMAQALSKHPQPPGMGKN